MNALLGSGETSGMLSELKDLEFEHDRAVNLCYKTSTSQSIQRVKEKLDSLTTFLVENEKALKKVEVGVDRLVSEANLGILDWISSVQYMDDHIFIKEKRVPNTASWLAKHPSFQHWEESESSALFWLQGTVGTGKSVLSSSVIDHLLENFMTSSEDGGFAYFYCDRQSSDRRETLYILRSLVRQLSTTIRSQNEMRQDLLKSYTSARQRGAKGLDKDTCVKQLQDSVKLYPRTVIVLDGLDECEKSQRKVLLDVLDTILALAKVKVFIASRPTQDLERRFDRKQVFLVDTTDNLGDIKTYVTQAIEDHEDWDEEEVTRETKDLVAATLCGDKASRRPMFRWVNLQLVQLFQCRSSSDVVARLGKLPPDLNESYNEIYQRNTKNLGPADMAHVERAFLWVLGADPRPPSDVIVQAVRFSQDGTIGDKVSKKTLLDLCQHLLTIDAKSDRWVFPHASVAEWVESRHWTRAHAQRHIGKVCVSRLLKVHEGFEPAVDADEEDYDDYEEENDAPQENDDGPKGEKTEDNPAQDYIQLHWPNYIRAANDAKTFDADLVSLLKDFLGSPMKSSGPYQGWVSWLDSAIAVLDTQNMPDISDEDHVDDDDNQLHSSNRDTWEYPFDIDVIFLQPASIALYAMVAYGFTDILMDWWESAEMDVTIKSDDYTLLGITNSLDVVKLLLKRGIDVNAPEENYGNALGRAIEEHDLEKVKVLVEIGKADVHAEYQYAQYSCPLEAATFSLEILKYLVEKGGADVNKPFEEGDPGSALATAAYEGSLNVVKYLANEANADINMKLHHGSYGTALVAGAYKGHLEVVRFFVLEKKVNVNEPVEHGRFGSVLAAAASSGNAPTVEFLVKEAGADVNMRIPHGDYGNALVAAAEGAVQWMDGNDDPRRNFDIIKFLVEEGKADVNMVLENGKYRTAMEAMEDSGRADVVEYFEGFAPKED